MFARPSDARLAPITDFVRRRRLAPIGGLLERPTGYFTGRPVELSPPVRDALATLASAGFCFFAADRVLIVASGRHALLVRRLAPGQSILLRKAFGGGQDLLTALDSYGFPDGEILDGDPPSAHRRLRLEHLLATTTEAARTAWTKAIQTRATRPFDPPPPLRFRRDGRFRWLAEDGQSFPWFLHEIP